MKIPNKDINQIYAEIGNLLDNVVYEKGFIAGVNSKEGINKNTAFKVVFEELSKNRMFQGHYDHQHGTVDFMCGIMTVMEYIAYNISQEVGNDFTNQFVKNMCQDKKKNEELWEKAGSDNHITRENVGIRPNSRTDGTQELKEGW